MKWYLVICVVARFRVGRSLADSKMLAFSFEITCNSQSDIVANLYLLTSLIMALMTVYFRLRLYLKKTLSNAVQVSFSLMLWAGLDKKYQVVLINDEQEGSRRYTRLLLGCAWDFRLCTDETKRNYR